jgi:Fe-Mn family superoxide dismutase
MASRRAFIKQSSLLVATGSIATTLLQSCGSTPEQTTESSTDSTPSALPTFEQTPLPYHFADLEPHIDTMTMEIHYSKHHAAYTKNLNEAIQAENITGTIEEILAKAGSYSTKLRNNAGGYYNHELFWKTMTPNGKPATGKLLDAINASFGDIETFKNQMTEAAKSVFGSGWAWLVQDGNTLKIGTTPNQDCPLMDVSELKGKPLLGLDVWEHAYYLKHQNKRVDYINDWWKVVNFEAVAERL